MSSTYNQFELEQKILRSSFDLETHKKTFINYCEVVILPSGVIEYAIPSHQEYLKNYIINNLGVSEKMYMSSTAEMYEAMCRNSNLIICRSHRFDVLGVNPTNEQILSLSMLIKEGLVSNEKKIYFECHR